MGLAAQSTVIGGCFYWIKVLVAQWLDAIRNEQGSVFNHTVLRRTGSFNRHGIHNRASQPKETPPLSSDHALIRSGFVMYTNYNNPAQFSQ
jgi:hypothetical protein